MRSSYRLLCPSRRRLMPVAPITPIALLAGRPVAASLGYVPGGAALAAAGGLAAASRPAAAISATGAGGGRPRYVSPNSVTPVNGVPFAITVS